MCSKSIMPSGPQLSRKGFLSILAGSGLCALFPSAAKAMEHFDEFEDGSSIELHIAEIINEECIRLLDRINDIGSGFYLSENKLYLSYSDECLMEEYGFSVDDITKVHAILALQHSTLGSFPQTRLHVSNWKIYFTYGEVCTLLWQAALAGPAAITAALTALGSVYPVVGNIIGAIIGAIGATTICYVVLQAVANKQGIYIGIDWNGAFPNPAFGYW